MAVGAFEDLVQGAGGLRAVDAGDEVLAVAGPVEPPAVLGGLGEKPGASSGLGAQPRGEARSMAPSGAGTVFAGEALEDVHVAVGLVVDDALGRGERGRARQPRVVEGERGQAVAGLARVPVERGDERPALVLVGRRERVRERRQPSVVAAGNVHPLVGPTGEVFAVLALRPATSSNAAASDSAAQPRIDREET